ncbi:MAG: hypothetical protein JXR63_00645 [Spirochaetales bacterium]|nr:hypothetical protein [Spirochaetales bacterium]
MKKMFFCLLTTFMICFSIYGFEIPESPFLHSHNDYDKDVPLFGAISEGADSMEADIHLVCGKIYTGHFVARLSASTIFETQYLQPLFNLYQQKGYIREPGKTMILLVDVKTSPKSTWKALFPLLEKYSEMLTHFSPGNIQWNAVTVIISGNSARQLIWDSPKRLAAVDGRPYDVGVVTELDKIPLISASWSKMFRVKADANISEKDLLRLRDLVKRVHSHGQLLRFYGGYESEDFIKLLTREKINIINADNLRQVKKLVGD